ncbi:hypothetical protein HN873_070761 [Arachis hypogaea]
MDPSDSDFFGSDSDVGFPRGDDLDFLDDDSEADEDRPQDKRISELSQEDIMQLQFTDEEAVYRFYKTYAMMHGFAVRLDEVRCDSDGSIIMRQIVCNRAGSRKEEVEKDERIRDHRPLTRSCCPARIRARLDTKIQQWKVVLFYEEHSHELVAPLDISMMPEYRTFSDGGKLYFKCNIFGVPEIHHVVEFDRIREILCCECLWFENRGIPCMHIFTCLKHQHVEVIPESLVCKRWTKNTKSDFMKSNVDDPSDSDKVLKCRLGVLGAECSRLMDLAYDDCVGDPLVVKSKGAPKKNSKFKQQRKCSNYSVTGHYNKSCPNAPGRIPKEPVDDDTETNISSILPKHKRHDSMKNQHKMEKDRNISGGTTPTSAAKSAFIDQVKTSSLGPNILVCASTSNEESGMGSIPAGSSVVAPKTGMAA